VAARRRFRPTPRRKMVWARTGGDEAPDATGVAVDLLETFRADGGSTIGSTITRVHLSLSLHWDALRPDATVNRLVVGVLVDQRDQAQSQVPRPAVELHADWMHWAPYPAVPQYSALTHADEADPATTGLLTSERLDIKSQRKCEELGDTLWAVFDPTYGIGGTLLSISWSASVLLKLP